MQKKAWTIVINDLLSVIRCVHKSENNDVDFLILVEEDGIVPISIRKWWLRTGKKPDRNPPQEIWGTEIKYWQKLSIGFPVPSDDFYCVKIRNGSKEKKLSPTLLFTNGTKNTMKRNISKVKIFQITIMRRVLHRCKTTFSPTKISTAPWIMTFPYQVLYKCHSSKAICQILCNSREQPMLQDTNSL